MKRSKIRLVLIPLIAVLTGYLLFVLIFGSPSVLWNNRRFKQKILSAAEETVVLHQLTPFEWDAVYTFNPYTSREEIARCIGFGSRSIQETVSEGMTQLLFVHEKKVVCSICGYPSGIGYTVSGMPYAQAILNCPDSPRFRLYKRGDIVYLEYLP